MAATAEIRFTAAAFALLPLGLAAYMILINENYSEVLLNSTTGHWMLGVAGGLQALGMILIWRMIQGWAVINLWFFAAMIMALLAVWVAWFLAPRWARGRVHARLKNAGDVEAESSSFWLSRFATRLTESSLAREDFREIQEAFSATGRNREQSQVLYLVYCWLIPAIVVFGGFVFLGPMGGMLVAAGAFCCRVARSAPWAAGPSKGKTSKRWSCVISHGC